jgi:hypothetical protein
MTLNRYRVVFDGRIAEGFGVEEVKKNLVSLYKIESQKIERIFAKRPVVIRKDVDRQTAEKFKRAFEKAGALCRIVPIEALGFESHPVLKSGNDSSQPIKQNRLSCPSCGYEQEESPECQRCGIIFSRLKEPLPRPPLSSLPTREPPPALKRQSRQRSLRSAVLLLIVLSFVLFGVYKWWRSRPVSHGPGMVAPSVPRQEMIEGEIPFSHKGYLITPLAIFWVEARVLSTKRYRSGRESDLSPVDLALGWGPMSDEAVLKHIEIGQTSRFYFWRTENIPVPPELIELSSANMHLIPARNDVARQVSRARRGSVIVIRGYLVQVDGRDGWQWRSSLTRTDTGAGACEIVWVEDFEIL